MEWKGKTRGGALGYLFFIFLIKKCGLTVAYFFLSTVVLYFIPFAPKATRSIWVYSRNRLKRGIFASALILLRNYYKLGQTLIDKIAIGCGMKNRFHFNFENYGDFTDILNSDTGVVIIGAHVGNWEVGVPFFDEYGKKINIVLYDVENQRIKEIMRHNSNSGDYKVIPLDPDGLSHVLAIKASLDRHEYICFQGDRFIDNERHLIVSFMGGRALFPAGPYLLASRLEVPVVFYFAMREKGRSYRFHFIPVSGLP